MKVRGKVVVVTGAGSGIGRALTLELLRRGARVAAVDISAETLAETASLSGAGPEVLSQHVVDVTDRARVAALPTEIAGALGPVDGVINNAGIIQPFVRLVDLDDATIERVLGVNLYGTLHMTRAFLPGLLTRPEGHVVNVSSMGGFLPVPGQTMYGAAKAAVKLMTEGLYAELLETRVRVSLVLPGAVRTNIMDNSGVTLDLGDDGGQERTVLSAEDAATTILDGMERDRPRILVGSDARFMDALCRLAPTFAARFIARQMRDLLPA